MLLHLPRRARASLPLTIAPLALLVVTGCTNAQLIRSAADIVGSGVLSGVMRGSTGSSGGSSGGSSAGRARGDYPTSASTATTTSRRVMGTAEEYVGVPYVWGGSTPDGFDCSGFVKYVYARQGIALPRTSREQARAGEPVARSWTALRQGDLMLFAEEGEPVSHVAIYAGDGRFIHSSSSGRGVRYDDLDSQRGEWYATHMVSARRLTRDGRSVVQSLRSLTQAGLPFDGPDAAPPPR